MKKVCLSLLVVVCALLGMTSCTSKNYCYKITEEYEEWDSSVEDWQSESYTWYEYCSPRCINVTISERKKNLKLDNCRKIKITKKKLKKSESACKALNYGSDYYNYGY